MSFLQDQLATIQIDFLKILINVSIIETRPYLHEYESNLEIIFKIVHPHLFYIYFFFLKDIINHPIASNQWMSSRFRVVLSWKKALLKLLQTLMHTF